MSKKLCECGKIAQWMYMPSGNVHCDNCVPRGCSCMREFKPGVVELTDNSGCIINPASDYQDILDELGRKVPCIEYSYDKDGFDEDDSPVDILTQQYELAKLEGRTL